MCGIFSVLGKKSQNINPNEYLNLQNHRGPDNKSLAVLREIFKDRLDPEVKKNKIKLNQPGSFDNFVFKKHYDACHETLKNGSCFDKKIINELENKKRIFDKAINGDNKVKKNGTNSSFLFKAVSIEIFNKTFTKHLDNKLN